MRMHCNNFFVLLVTHHKSTMCISCPCNYYLHTRQQKEEEKICATWQIYHDQFLLVKIDRLHKDKDDDRWPHKNKNKNSVGGSERKMANFHQRYTTNITLIALQFKSCQKWHLGPHHRIIVVLEIIVLAYSSKIALEGPNVHVQLIDFLGRR
jgi:hypothetical protein